MNSEKGMSSPQIFNFANFRLDLDQGLLLRDEEAIDLKPKALEMLRVFVESEGRVITRPELMEKLWADSFVEENNISQHVRALRKALGEGENGNKFIETLPRRGFRFLPEVKKAYIPDAAEDENAWGNENSVTDIHKPHTPEAEPVQNRTASGDVEAGAAPPMRRSIVRWPHVALISTGITVTLASLLLWNYYRSPEGRVRYINEIGMAAHAWEASNFPLMKKLLDKSKPETGERDFRGFEWGYLSRLHSEAMSSQPIVLDHDTGVDDVVFSPDGRTVASGSANGSVRLWDVETGELRGQFQTSGWVLSLAFSPSGSLLATAGLNGSAGPMTEGARGSVKIWDAATGNELRTLTAETDVVSGVAFTPDGKSLAAAGGGLTRVWEVETGEERTEKFKWALGGHPIAFSPDGRLFASRGDENSAEVREIATGRVLAVFRGHTGWLSRQVFSPDSRSLLTAGTDKTAKLWDIETKRNAKTFTGHTGTILELSFAGNGKIVGTGSSDGTTRLWDADNGHELTTLKGHLDWVIGLAFSPDSRKIASGGGVHDRTVRIWNVPQSPNRGVIRAHSKGVSAVAFSPNGKYLASAGEDHTARIWNVETESEYLPLGEHADGISSLAFSPDGNALATGGRDKKIRVWDVGTGRRKYSINTSQPVDHVSFSPDGKYIASSYWWGGAGFEIWEAATGKVKCDTSVYKAGVYSIEWANDSKRFVTSSVGESGDRTIRHWDAATCKATSVFGGDEFTYVAANLPNGDLIALKLLNGDRSIQLVNTVTGKEQALISGHEATISAFGLSFDGKRLVTGGSDGLVKLWDVVSGQNVLMLRTTSGEINAVAFKSDGLILAAGGSDGKITLWRADRYWE